MNAMLRGKTEEQRGEEMLAFERLQAALNKRDTLPCDKRPWGEAVTLDAKNAKVLKVVIDKGPVSARDIAKDADMTARDVSIQIQRLKKLGKVKTAEVKKVYHYKKPYRTHFYEAI